ncbi:unnamed protein product, partial [Allacma fusca]
SIISRRKFHQKEFRNRNASNEESLEGIKKILGSSGENLLV